MDRNSNSTNRSQSEDLRKRTTQRRLQRPSESVAPDSRSLRPPTVVSLPVRDGVRTFDLPLTEAYQGLESLAREDSVSLVYEDGPSDQSTSELSVVFKGVHPSERPAPPDSSPMGPPSSVRPPPVSNPALHARSHVPGPAPVPTFGGSGSGPHALPLPPPPSLPPPPRAFSPYASFEPARRSSDFDDDVDTKVMPPRSALPEPVQADSLQPVALQPPPRGGSGLPRVVVRRDQPRRALPWVLAAAGLIGGGALSAFALWWEGSQGELVIDVADQQCGAVEDVQIYVDDRLACTASPCSLQVSKGSHVVRAEAAGYAVTAPAAVLVDPEVPTLHKVQFGATTKTGVEVRSKMSGLSLYLDGKLVGQLPQRVTGLSTGEHVLLVTGGEDYYAEERKIELDADELMVLDDIELTPKAGTLRIAARPELEGASVLLDGQPITLPFSKQLQTNRRYQVQARRTGYEDFEAWVELDAKQRTKDLDIQLVAKAPAGLAHASNAQASRSDVEPEGAARRKEARSTGEEGAASARLNLLSDPPSMVLLNGKPLGQTPRTGVSVNAGTHAVLFIHPTLGRARASAKLEAGQAKTLRARF